MSAYPEPGDALEPLSAAIRAAQAWREHDPDPLTRAATDALIEAHDAEGLAAAFGTRLSFGTAGIRGKLGPGPGFLNRRLVGLVAAGIAAVWPPDGRGIVVARDARHGSAELAAEVAAVLTGAGFRVWRFHRPTPTPVAAFAVRCLGARGGVVVTASHNPPEYNGVKVFAAGGRQILAPVDSEIAAAMRAAEGRPLARLEPKQARAVGRLEDVDAVFEAAYQADLLRRLPPLPGAPALRVVYTPLHGVGGRWAEAVLRAQGCEPLSVAEQRAPDGSFPTVAFPNPEEAGALDLAFALAEREGVGLVLANDPDADRLAVAVRDGDGFRRLTGDELGILLADQVLRGLERRGRLPGKAGLVTTVVSSGMLRRLAERRGHAYAETLTGFKWIAGAFEDFAADGIVPVFGYEEALGYLVCGNILDKDGLSAAVVAVQLAQEEAAAGRGLLDRLDALQAELGVFACGQRSLWLEGGQARLSALMARLRERPLAPFPGEPWEERSDFLEDGHALPKSDILRWQSARLRLTVRPSGTEPKVKLYAELEGAPAPDERVADCRARLAEELADRLETIHTQLQALAAAPEPEDTP